MNNQNYQTNHYTSPKIEVIVVEVEQGIAVTNENVGDTNPELDWAK